MRRRTILLFLISIYLSISVSADVIVLKDGRTFEGRIVERDQSSISIDCLVNGIRSTLVFNRLDIEEIREELLNDEFFNKNANSRETDDEPPDTERKSRARYTTVLLHGLFGEEIHSVDVQKVLNRAKRKCEYIIFDIHSPGGFIDESLAVAKLMQQFDNEFDYVALVRRAEGAAVYPAFSCDIILLEEGGHFGAADEIQLTNSNDKRGSTWAAELAAEAARKGWNPDVATTMAVKESRLWVWRTEDESIHWSKFRPQHVDNPQSVSDENKVLTITSGLARQCGFPIVVPKDVTEEGIGPFVAPDSQWTRESKYGRIVYQDAVDQWEEFKTLFEGRHTLKDVIDSQVKEAIDNNPNNFKFIYETKTVSRFDHATKTWIAKRSPTEKAWDDWYMNTDIAIDLWQGVASDLEQLAHIEDMAAYYHRDRVYDFRKLKKSFERCQREIDRLFENRSRGPTIR